MPLEHFHTRNSMASHPSIVSFKHQSHVTTRSCHFPPFVCAGVLLSSESHSVGTIYKRAQRWRNYDAISTQKTEPVDATHRPVRSGWMFSFARARGSGEVGWLVSVVSRNISTVRRWRAPIARAHHWGKKGSRHRALVFLLFRFFCIVQSSFGYQNSVVANSQSVLPRTLVDFTFVTLSDSACSPVSFGSFYNPPASLRTELDRKSNSSCLSPTINTLA